LLIINALPCGAATERLFDEELGMILPSRTHLSLGTALDPVTLTKEGQKVIAPVDWSVMRAPFPVDVMVKMGAGD
jgi:hypothetical protein